MRALLPLVLCSVTTGCAEYFGDKDREMGEPLGVYSLQANADMTSTCTEIINATPRPWSFEITLRRDGKKGYWVSGPEPIEGSIDEEGQLAFKQTIPVTVHGVDKARGLGACTILRTDDFAGQLAGAPTTTEGKASFTGTLRYSYQIAAGSDCRDVVGVPSEERTSPLFAVLPCDARFAVAATRKGDVTPR
ncbi:MAG: hypothetical protein HYV09_30850 [Deltaproteobacteria bacterium]|nr:hypothetical protein [Deltaproteobacteria bacterium]